MDSPLTRPWNGPADESGIGFIKPQLFWCAYGKHYFETTSRNAVCCNAAECRDARKKAQRESNRRSRAKRIAKGAKN